tara:strand:+ start:190 stop:2088 length:1899 start_codon:yes stop_codon:yes gene_type:complete
MDKLISVLLCILLTTFSLAGCLGDSDNETSEDTDNSENTGNNETIILFEGDQAGECSDGADNDRDGLFDCDDPNCAGSPTCKISEENNTNLDENKTQTGDEYSDFDDEIMVNLTNDMITSGYMDEADCNLLLLLQNMDPIWNRYDLKNQLLQTNLTNAPNYKIWIATYEDVDGSALLPALYDWRNGEIDTTLRWGLYVFDDDEVSYLGAEFRRGTDLGNICLPSQRDGLTNLFELIDPPFNWSLPILTAEDIHRFNQSRNSNEPLCEIVMLNHGNIIGDGLLDRIHDDAVTAVNRIGESDVNVWFMNSTNDYYDDLSYAMAALNNFNGAPEDFIPNGHFFIIDNNVLSDWTETNYFGYHQYHKIGNPCHSEDRDDVYRFFHEYGLHPFYNGNMGNIIVNASIDTSYKNNTEYNILEKSMFDENKMDLSDMIHTDSTLMCLINEENHEFYNISQTWLINNQTVQGEILDLKEYDVSIGDSVTCSMQIEDLLTSKVFIDNWNLTISERLPIAQNMEIIQEEGLASCDFKILNPDNLDYVPVVVWMVDSNDDGILSIYDDWVSNPSTNYTLDVNNTETINSPDTHQSGKKISCILYIFSPDVANSIVGLELYDGEYYYDISELVLSVNSVEGIIE